jgi:hypothetical protein
MQRYRGETYVKPLREGGSLPAVVTTDRPGMFVVKFRGAGQGAKALIAEALAAQLALELGLPTPEPAIITLAAEFGRSEPDEEIQDILRGSIGDNFGAAFLEGALAFDPAVGCSIDPRLAADIVWFDAYITNVDRTARNPNLLVQHDQLWLIDHGASLYFQHRWEGWRERIHSRFPQVKDHVLLHQAGDLREADARLRSRLRDATLTRVVQELPDEWLIPDGVLGDVPAIRSAYTDYLSERLSGDRPWLDEAIEAQQRGPQQHVPRVTRRVV